MSFYVSKLPHLSRNEVSANSASASKHCLQHSVSSSDLFPFIEVFDPVIVHERTCLRAYASDKPAFTTGKPEIVM